MQCSVAVSKEANAELAGKAVARSIKNTLGSKPPDLALLFFSPNFIDETRLLVDIIHHELSPRLLVGCMGDGVIGSAEELEGTPAVILWAAQLPGASLLPIRLQANEDEHASAIKGWPEELEFRSDHPFFMLFADPFSTPIDEVFSTLEQYCPGSQAIGGIASGGTDLGENRLVLNQGVYENRVGRDSHVGAGLHSNLGVTGVPADWRTVCGDQGRTQYHL